LRVRQSLNRQPHLIDQCLPIADFPAPFDTRQRIPQRQKLLAAEPRSVQLRMLGDGDFAVIDDGRRLAGQRDPVITNDLPTHEWVLRLLRHSPVTPLPLSSAAKATLFPMILWRCQATVEHGPGTARPLRGLNTGSPLPVIVN